MFTHLLVGVFSLFGPSMESARALVLFFSSGLIVAAIAFLRGIGEGRYALIGRILLLLMPRYIRLSMSVMIGLPALSLAMVSLAVLVSWHRQQNPAMLIASAWGNYLVTRFIHSVLEILLIVLSLSVCLWDTNQQGMHDISFPRRRFFGVGDIYVEEVLLRDVLPAPRGC